MGATCPQRTFHEVKVPSNIQGNGSCILDQSSPILTNDDLSIIRELFPDNSTSVYYDKKYWSWQKGMGDQGGTLEQWKFKPSLEQISGGRQLGNHLIRCIDFGVYSLWL
jgi:hypothetical protein